MNKSRRLNSTNVEVFPIGLGAMPLSLAGRPDEIEALDVINTFIDGGGDFIDTANVYCADETDVGHNEKLIAKALSRSDNQIIVATKGGLRRPTDNWTVDASPAWLRHSCEKSLVDLNSDSIFLYQLHAPDPEVPLMDSIGELAKLKDEGKIQHIGLSNVTVEHIELALSITHIISVQNRCNLFERTSFKNGVVDFCENNNITFIAHSPVGGHYQHKQHSENILLKRLSEKFDTSSYQIMIAWLLHKSSSIFPIPGASKASSIKGSIQALNVELSKEDMQLLEAIIN
ncbi:MAG: aryl-alcohol dehydrogenase-like predicted oxidoreductase [Enterobacterales bacterium]|jgi:aryl-alcohol dehydrogenase-like predicted oxidoreductase